MGAIDQVLDNTALDAIAQQQLGIAKPSVAQGNSLVSTVMAAATAATRFPGALPLHPHPISRSRALSSEHILLQGFRVFMAAASATRPGVSACTALAHGLKVPGWPAAWCPVACGVQT